LDIAKGFAILLVVLGHSLDGLLVSSFFPPTLSWPALSIFTLSLFVVPLFFAVSGHLAAGKHRSKGPTLIRLLSTIVYAYFFWSILKSLALLYLGRYTNTSTWIETVSHILWIPLVPYGFLYSLFLCHLGYMAIRRFSQSTQLIIATAIFLAPQFFLSSITGAHLVIVVEIVRGFFYFVLGAVSVTQLRQFGRWMAFSATILFILFAIVYYQSQLSGAIAAPAALPAGVAGIVAALAWSRMLADSNNPIASLFARPLAFCGRYSMSIYVMHIFFTAGIRIAIRQFDFVPSLPAALGTFIEIAAAGIAGILLPLGVNWIISKFDLDKWLGLQHMEST
jgi:fucose 4-O-acetylase-like acetyltransferase